MGASMRLLIGFIMLLLCHVAVAKGCKSEIYMTPHTAKYSQKELLKNWTLSVCFAIFTKNDKNGRDAGETAASYLEFGKQDLDAYDKLRTLAKKYVNLKYSTIGPDFSSELNTMKCIDLFHSKELDDLANQLSKKKIE
jgi:hypothetical protein